MKNFFLAFCISLGFLPLWGDISSNEASAMASIQEAKERLVKLRREISDEKIPLSKRLSELEGQVLNLRKEAERQQRLSDASGLDINALEANYKAREEEVDYISSLITEYLSSLETRADPSELLQLRSDLDTAFVALDNPELSKTDQLKQALVGIELGINRLKETRGGRILGGEAIMTDGTLAQGKFLLYGPLSYFRSEEGVSGMSVRGSTEIPVLLPIASETDGIEEVFTKGSGLLPVDPTLGKAAAIASTDETLIEHILKGGVWIFPILFSAGLSLLIACFKFLEIFGIKKIEPFKIRDIVKAMRKGEKKEALSMAKELPRPISTLMIAGVENADEPKELLEEILLEKIVETQPRVERLLPIIAVTAATAPLLGLLGTVTGMINTFKLITIFGTGDAKSLSSGISEALITTEFGLIVAIPSLILHAILNRRAKAIMSGLEASAMTFVNGISAKRKEEEAA